MSGRVIARMIAAFTAAAAAIAMLPLTVSAERESLLILGDSISSGYAVEEGEYAYYDYLTQCMNYEMTNMAVAGYTTQDLMTLMATEETQAAIAEADVISVSIGANDILGPFLTFLDSLLLEGETYPELFQRLNAEGSLASYIVQLSGYLRDYISTAKINIQQIETDILALNPDVRLVVQTIYNPVEYDASAFEGTEYESSYKTLNNYVRNSCNMINEAILALENSLIADVAGAFEGTGWIYIRVREEDVHPTQLGHALIGATVLNALSVTEGKTLAMRVTLDGVTAEDAAVLPEDDRALLENYAGEYYLKGDVDNNTVIDSTDALLTLQHYTRVSVMQQDGVLDSFGEYAADVDSSGALDGNDALGVLQYYVRRLMDDTITWDDIFPA